MKVKGTAVKTIGEYVRKMHPDQYNAWVDALDEKAKVLYKEGIYSNQWYDVAPAAIEPTIKVGKMFFNNNLRDAAWNLGRYSADTTLTGIYKLYVKASSPKHIIDRANRAFSAYYEPSNMVAHTPSDKSVIARILTFDPPSEIIEYRIAGWMERALELSGCKSLEVKIVKSLARGDEFTEFHMSWS